MQAAAAAESYSRYSEAGHALVQERNRIER